MVFVKNGIYAYHGLFLSFKKEQITNIQNNMDGFQKHYAKGKKTGTKDYPLYESIYMIF